MSHKKYGSIEINSTDIDCADATTLADCSRNLAQKTSCTPPKVTSASQVSGCCSKCGYNQCKCCEVPASYFRQGVNICPENSKQIIIIEKKSQVFTASQSFCMPACGQSIRVRFDGITDVAIGAYLWALGVGALKIKGYNSRTEEIELENTCSSGCDQVPAGTPIPQCTAFVLMVPPCGPGSVIGTSSLSPFLNSGFTAPGVGDCIDIAVTNVNGLSVNKNVSIQSGTYRISAIASGTQITICNDGVGLPAGQVVDYRDGEGNLIVPVILIDNNPCLNTSSLSGKLLVCDNGTMVPLGGTVNGQIPVLDISTGEVDFRTLGIPTLSCTTLTVDLTLNPAFPSGTSYVAFVADTSELTGGDTIFIGGVEFSVDSVDSGTQLHITPAVDPAVIQTYQEGALVCEAGCCEVLSDRIDNIQGQVSSDDSTTAGLPITMTVLGTSANSAIVAITVTNSLVARNLLIHFTFDFFWKWFVTGTNGQFADINYSSYIAAALNNPAVAVGVLHASQACTQFRTGSASQATEHESRSGAVVIAPGDTYTLKAQAAFEYDAGNAASVVLQNQDCHISLIAHSTPV